MTTDQAEAEAAFMAAGAEFITWLERDDELSAQLLALQNQISDIVRRRQSAAAVAGPAFRAAIAAAAAAGLTDRMAKFRAI